MAAFQCGLEGVGWANPRLRDEDKKEEKKVYLFPSEFALHKR